MAQQAVSPATFATFGGLLKYLRRREELTQRELAIQVGYSDTQISRLEQNQRVPDDATLMALFVPALHIEKEADWTARLLELARAARTGEPTSPESIPPTPALPPNNLPSLLTAFIGREAEQAEVLRWIAAQRLVTLTGTGGIGKTRLALESAGSALARFPDGVWFVDLAPLSDPAALPQTVASALDIIAQSTSLPHLQLLINFLRPKTALLLLDNCEHLLDGCAALAEALLRECPSLRILATSREPLGVPGEQQYRLPALPLPEAEHTLERVQANDAARLFEARAALAQPGFRLTDANAAAVARICARLDGLPLAIELAAARLSAFSAEQIAARLEDRFSLLTGGSRTALPRQQTIRASIDWSWNLLTEPERRLLGRLAVFAGGWTLEAAEAVCGTGELDPAQVDDLLARLVAKSLVMAARGRFHMHEMVRQYAQEKLAEAGEEPSLRRAHMAYYRHLSEQASLGLYGREQVEWFVRLGEERGNLRAAREQAMAADPQTALVIATRLGGYWRYYDLREGLRWVTEAVELPGARKYASDWAWARLTQGQYLWYMQQFGPANDIAVECLALFRTQEDVPGELDSLGLMGSTLQFLEGMGRKTEYHLRALELARALGDKWRQAVYLAALGWDQRDPARGCAWWKEALPLLRQTGDWRALAQTLGIYGFTSLHNGEFELARRLLDEAYEINQRLNGREMEFVLTGRAILYLLGGEFARARALLQENITYQEQVGNRMGYLWGRARLAYIALREGNPEEARGVLAGVIADFHADGNLSGLAFALDRMAELHAAAGGHAAAARLIGWSDAVRGKVGDPRPVIEQDDVDRDLAAARKALGAKAFKAAYAAGGKMTLDEAVSLAL